MMSLATPAAAKKAHGTDNDRLAGARFTGQHVEPGFQFKLHAIDHREAVYFKVRQQIP